jgi:tetratricopeptide (TPR) repeat protein
LEKLESGNPHLHFNLGAALSDKGKFDDARVQLNQAIQLDPSPIDARTTLGLTYARQGRHEEALKVFEETAAKAPQNPFIWRALGGTLRLVPGRLPEAKECLLKATELAPTDPLSWLGYGDVCEKMELWEEASAAFQKCRNLNPPEALAEKAEEGINRLTSRSLRPKTETGEEMLRMDAVMYMQEALPLFAKMNPEQLKQAALELAMAGQDGLDLKDPTPKHSLKSFPGVFSGMKIVSYMYAAFQQFMPGADVGIDLSREYAAVTGKP